LDRDLSRLLALGVNHRPHELINPSRVKQIAREYDAVVLATGRTEPITLGFSGIDVPGVEQGLTFLNRVKTKGKEKIQGTVAVIGGGNTALDCAGTAIRCGADRVLIVYRRDRTEMPAIREEIDDTLLEGAELIECRQPVRIIGDDVVIGLEVAEVDLGDHDESGRKRPIVTDKLSVIPCNHILIAVGQNPHFGVLPSGWVVKNQRTYDGEKPLNVWLAGDISTGAGTVAHAIGNGRMIANHIMGFLSGPSKHSFSSSESRPQLVSANRIRLSCFPARDTFKDRRINVSARILGFDEVNLGISSAEETERCLSCGNCAHCDNCLIYCPEGIIGRSENDYSIDLDYCKGCGICVYECPRHAMEMSFKL
jgi:Pyruvate/2-oxoacid:ferredoxin oxidoreductase delta subunit/thioredoxin reductase